MSIKEKRIVAATYLTEVYCSMTLEDYKQQVYDYLTTKLKVSTTLAKNRMKEYDDFLEEFLEEKYPVSAAATAMMYNY
jgi:hypothetical protein